MDRCNCKKCGKLCNLNRFEMCKDCLQVDKVCRCGAAYRGSPGTRLCNKCNKENTDRYRARQAQKSKLSPEEAR